MKNIHVLPTDKPSRLFLKESTLLLNNQYTLQEVFPNGKCHHIYITSKEEIKGGDYWIYNCPINGLDYGDNNNPIVKNSLPSTWFEKLHDKENYEKIILTDNQDLISDGVQAIDDEFLEYFIKRANDSGKAIDIIEVQSRPYFFEGRNIVSYKPIIPQEPKPNNMKNKTAVNWLEAEFLKLEQLIGVHGCMYELIEKAKELEKQQIINASNDSYLNGELIKRSVNNKKVNSVGQQYYNETYGGNYE